MKEMFKQFWMTNGSRGRDIVWEQIKDEKTKHNHAEWIDKIQHDDVRNYLRQIKCDSELVEENVIT